MFLKVIPTSARRARCGNAICDFPHNAMWSIIFMPTQAAMLYACGSSYKHLPFAVFVFLCSQSSQSISSEPHISVARLVRTHLQNGFYEYKMPPAGSWDTQICTMFGSLCKEGEAWLVITRWNSNHGQLSRTEC